MPITMVSSVTRHRERGRRDHKVSTGSIPGDDAGVGSLRGGNGG